MTRPCFITWCRWNQPTAPDRNLLILKHDAVLATHNAEESPKQHSRRRRAQPAAPRRARNAEVGGDGHVPGAVNEIPKPVVVALLRQAVVAWT